MGGGGASDCLEMSPGGGGLESTYPHGCTLDVQLATRKLFKFQINGHDVCCLTNHIKEGDRQPCGKSRGVPEA